MSHSERTSFSELRRYDGRTRGDSDATLVEYEPSAKKDFEQSVYPLAHKGYIEEKLREFQSSRRESFSKKEEDSAHRRPSCLKRNSRSHHSDGQSSRTIHRPQQRTRMHSVRFQSDDTYAKSMQSQKSTKFGPKQYCDDDYDYGFVQVDVENDGKYKPSWAFSSRDDDFDDDDLLDLPQPVTTPQRPADTIQYGPYSFLAVPREKKGAPLASRNKDSIVQASTKPEAAARAKRIADLKKREEEATLCRSKRFSEYNAHANAERIAGGQTKGQPKPKPSPKSSTPRQGPEYTTRLAEEYARQNARLRAYDQESNKPRKPTNAFDAAAYSSYRRNVVEAERIRRSYIAQELRKLAPRYDAMAGEEKEAIDRLFRGKPSS